MNKENALDFIYVFYVGIGGSSEYYTEVWWRGSTYVFKVNNNNIGVGKVIIDYVRGGVTKNTFLS